jgi:hypothetical protein
MLIVKKAHALKNRMQDKNYKRRLDDDVLYT